MADKELFAYCLVRTDLPSLGAGKAIAHGMHAGNKMTWDLCVVPLRNGEEIDNDVMAWHAQGGGFGTTIALGKGREITLATQTAIVDAVRALGGKGDQVIDTSYPYLVDNEIVPFMNPDIHTMPPVSGPPGQTVCFRNEITTAYVFGDKTMLKIVLGQFGLYPND